MDQDKVETNDEESAPSPPFIKETMALMEDMDCDAKKIAELEEQLTKKQEYLFELERYEKNLLRSNAKLRSTVSFVNGQKNFITSHDGSIKNLCKNIDATIRTLEGEANILKRRLDKIYAKALDVEKSQQEDLDRYEKRLHHLQAVVTEIKERRKRKMDRIEAEETSLKLENVQLKAQLKALTELEFDATVDDDDSYIKETEEDIKELRAKLENLEKEHKVLIAETMEYDCQEKELEKEFSDAAYSELEKRFDQVNADASQLMEAISNETEGQQETLKTLHDLEAYEKKLDAELEKTQNFMDLMQQNHKEELSKFDEQIEATRKCCEEKSVKHFSVCEEINKNSKALQEKEKLLEEIAEIIKNIQNELYDLETSNKTAFQETINLSKQSEESRRKVDELLAEKAFIETQIATDDPQLEEVTKKLKLLKTRIETDTNNITSTQLNLEKEKTKELEEATVKLSELEVRRKAFEMEKESLEKMKAALRMEFEEVEMKTLSMSSTIEKEKEKRRLTAPRPVSISKTPATPAPKKEDNRKRNWNSDSSVEEIPLSKWSRKLNKAKRT